MTKVVDEYEVKNIQKIIIEAEGEQEMFIQDLFVFLSCASKYTN